MAEEKKKSKSDKLYDHGSGAPGSSEAKAKAESTAGDEKQSDVGAKHSVQRTAMHHRHGHERATVHHRHHVEHSSRELADGGKDGAKSSDEMKAMHDRHEAETKDMHKRHQKEAGGLMEAQSADAGVQPAGGPSGDPATQAMAEGAGAPAGAAAAGVGAAQPTAASAL